MYRLQSELISNSIFFIKYILYFYFYTRRTFIVYLINFSFVPWFSIICLTFLSTFSSFSVTFCHFRSLSGHIQSTSGQYRLGEEVFMLNIMFYLFIIRGLVIYYTYGGKLIGQSSSWSILGGCIQNSWADQIHPSLYGGTNTYST